MLKLSQIHFTGFILEDLSDLNQDDYLSVCIIYSLYIVLIQSACTYLILDLLNLKDVYVHNLKYSWK